MKITIEGGELVIRVPVNGKGRLSASGKSYVVASTQGFVAVPDSELRVNLNVIRPGGGK